MCRLFGRDCFIIETIYKMKKHFVTFISPGTFVHEETTLPIHAWDIEEACKIAHSINERYGARPFAFQFSTRERGENDLDSKVTKTSGRYFLGGKLLTAKEIKAMEDKPGQYDILISNMRYNNWPRVVMNDNSWRTFQPLGENDRILDFKLKPLTKTMK
jgi:hypothetical protein